MVPNLRFKEFHTEWKKLQIGNLIKERKEYTSDFEKYPLYSFTLESGITPKSERYERSFLVKKEGDLFKIVHQNDFVMNPMNLRFGAINYSKINQIVSVSGYYDIFTIDECKYNEFWNAYFKTPRMIYTYNTIATGSLVEKKRVYFKQLKELKMYIPNDMEKNKINEFINLLNERIQTQIKIIELKQSLIKDIEDRILWKSTNTHSRPISDFIVELNDKSKIQNQYPLLSSTKRGLFLQSDYFNKEAASSNNIGYKIVHKGDIIISPQNLWMGNITYNDKFDNGLVSPSYRIYKVKEEYNAFYISRILMSYRALSLYKNISEQGASIVRRNLNVDAFNELCFPIPDIKKQDEVGLFLSKLHQELNSEIEILRQLKNQKKYLLCNLFI
jgi:type I restriction enzyme S subunit